ncbi:MAG: hypothetical protein LBH11_02800 [Propionibacteriaceae bacterium]|jgi:nitroreductase|nr:hypothetical protein [Propionibacteriaceae bacterium]
MSIVAAIQARRSIRAYDGQPLSAEHVASLQEFIAATRPPFDVSASIVLVHNDEGAETQRRLGAYGTIKGARDFLGLGYAAGPLTDLGAAYWFEQVVLHCTALGLGTCWLAGFTRGSFLGATFSEGHAVRFASPVGIAGGSRPLIERLGLYNSDKVHANKKPFGKLFVRPDFTTPLTEADAGELALPLEMARLSPSARNLQPYRFCVVDGVVHCYVMKGYCPKVDLGIALAHLGLTCAEIGIAGEFRVLDDAPVGPNGLEYVISWA